MAGMVTLVGAGPGPGLITVMGLQAVREAEVLVFDDLVDEGLLGEAPAECEKIYAGKRSGSHSMPQEKINLLLVRKAGEGKRVVRLKGGDSFVFGRGGEECLALEEAGIPCRVIPGVSSAIAVPEHLGIPVTHRGAAQSFTVVTGHTGTEERENYEALAGLKGTLVFLMGMRSLPEIAGRLMACGKDPETPAAVLCRGFSDEEQRIDGTLATIAELAKDVPTPGILVVGKTAGMRLCGKKVPDTESEKVPDTIAKKVPDTGDGTGELSGARVTVAGTEQFSGKTAGRLAKLGAQTRQAVCMEVQPLAENIPGEFGEYGWAVFTSANGIELFFRFLKEKKIDLRKLGDLKIACIGPGTAGKLSEHGFTADLVPEEYTSAALGNVLLDACKNGQGGGRKVLILRAEQGSQELTDILEKAGIPYEDRKIYRTVPVLPAVDEAGETGNYLVFGSAGCVRAWFSCRGIPEGTIPVCIGAVTREELEKHYTGRMLTAESYTAEGIAGAISRDFAERGRRKT